ncbi:MAG: peroxidase family protein, partial [Pseudomonadota bacterium]
MILFRAVSVLLVLSLWCTLALAQQDRDDRDREEGFELLNEADEQGDRTSPVRRIQRNPRPSPGEGNRPPPGPQAEEQSLDGSDNNPQDPQANAIDTPLRRATTIAYADGISEIDQFARPSPREISSVVSAQEDDRPNPLGLSDYLWQWGQFLDHDIDLTDGADPAEPANIAVPSGDAWFDPTGSATQEIAFNRSLYDHDSGTSIDNPRQQVNEISGWIDASNVYGSDEERALALRTLDGTGRLKVSDGDFLPFNEEGLENAGGTSDALFVAGDVRANEQVGLAVMHTLFVREHNRLAKQIARDNPRWDGERVFQHTRRLVIGMMQAITYNEFLPALLGPNAIDDWNGYDPSADARIMNVFSTSAYRLGHSLLSPMLLRLDENLDEAEHGHLSLADAFFSPSRITEEGGIEPILRGLAHQQCQDFDVFVIDEVRNFLFGPPGAGGFDLVSLNIQRGRDHGLPGYNEVRRNFGLRPRDRFAQITRDRTVVARLAEAYASTDDIDPWVGGLAEDPRRGGLVGELVGAILIEQFTALRDGDRFWYER